MYGSNQSTQATPLTESAEMGISDPTPDVLPSPPLSPLVDRVRAVILKELSSGRYAIAERVPAQREWARKFGVSGFTVQRALEALKREGIVESREGSYTFLRQIPTADDLALRVTEQPGSRTQISIWAQDPRELRWVRRSIARQRFQNKYQAEHPEVEIEERLFDLPGAEIEARLVSSIMRTAEPTFGVLTRTCVPFLADSKCLAPIGGSEESDSYLERLDSRWLQACTWGGQLRVLPINIGCSFLFYNRSLFREAGLDPDRPPRDWAEFSAATQKLMAASGGKASFHLPNNLYLVWWLMQLVYQAVPVERDAEPAAVGPSLPRLDWMSGPARTALEFFVELQGRRVVQVHDGDLRSLVSQNLRDQVPMMMGNTQVASVLVQLGQAERFGIAPLPAGPNGECLSMLNCIGWFVNAHATPAQRDAASRYVFARERWVHEGDGGAEMRRLGIFPPLLSVLKNPSADQHLAHSLPKQWAENLEHLTAVGRWEPADSDWKKDALCAGIADWLGLDSAQDPALIQQCLALCESNDDKDPFNTTV